MRGKEFFFSAAALALYALGALVFTYPLVFHIKTHTLAYASQIYSFPWNAWYFHHALNQGLNPLWGELQFWPFGVNLLTHTYTLGHTLAGYFLYERLGAMGSVNISLLLCIALGGWAVFLLARHSGASQEASFIAGFLVAFSSFSMMHLGLATLEYSGWWPMPFFFLFFRKAQESPTIRNCFLAGLFLSFNFLYAQYYLTFSLVFACFLTVLPHAALSRWAWPLSARAKYYCRLFFLAAFVIGILWWFKDFSSLGQVAWRGSGSFRQILRYVTPYWIIGFSLIGYFYLRGTELLMVRVQKAILSWKTLQPLLATCLFYAALNAPLIISMVYLSLTGSDIEPPARWRGGGTPLDLARFLLPNIEHPFIKAWVPTQEYWNFLSDSLNYSFDSLGWVLPIFIFVEYKRYLAPQMERSMSAPSGGLNPRARPWLICGLFSLIFSLGPYLKILTVETYFPLPFWLIRQIPLLGSNIQAVTFFNYTTLLFFAIAAALALDRVIEERSAFKAKKRRLYFACALGLVLFENLIPLPRTLYPMPKIPTIYKKLKNLPQGVTLVIPFGAQLRYANNPFNDFDRVQLYYQTIHEHIVLGGVTGRTSFEVFQTHAQDPFLKSLAEAQEAKDLVWNLNYLTDRALLEQSFQRWNIRYVIMESHKIPRDLFEVIKNNWPIELLEQDGAHYLFRILL